MKRIITITGFFAILGIAIVGILYIFDVMSFEDSRSVLLKTLGAIVLLGGCTALIKLLMSNKEESPDQASALPRYSP
jgi:type IV secretory pathway VirB2 component (pilin)